MARLAAEDMCRPYSLTGLLSKAVGTRSPVQGLGGLVFFRTEDKPKPSVHNPGPQG